MAFFMGLVFISLGSHALTQAYGSLARTLDFSVRRRGVFKDAEASLQLILLRGAGAGGEERGAGRVGFKGHAAGCGDAGEVICMLPKTGAGKEGMLERGAGHLLELRVGEMEVDRGARVLVCEVNAGDAFIIC